MSVEVFESLPWESICYASITACCIALIFKHCFQVVEKLFTLIVLVLAAVEAYNIWQFVKTNGWAELFIVVSGKLQEQKENLPPPASAALGTWYSIKQALWR